MKKMKKMPKSGAYRWMLTLKADEYDQTEVESKLAPYRYVGQLETGEETGYVHWQIYINNNTQIRFETLQNKFPIGHFEIARSTDKHCYDYVRKNETFAGVRVGQGIWDFDEDGAQRQIDPSLMESLHDSIFVDGRSVDDILCDEPRAMRYVHQLRQLEAVRDNMRWKTQDRNVTAHYIYGTTGTGKTKYVHDLYRGEMYRVSDYKNPFDGYNGEPVLVLDEYREQLPMSLLLNVLDRYPLRLPARYNDRWAAYDTVYVISNLELRAQHCDVYEQSPETWDALMRRFDTVSRMETGGRLILEDEPKKRLQPTNENHDRSNHDTLSSAK